MSTEDRKIALFLDLENLVLGIQDANLKKFDIALVLERILEKGKIVFKKAYCCWERFPEYKRPFHEAAIEITDIPKRKYSGKNSADIRMVVDAMDLCHSKEHINTFVIASGDSDFSPLVSKLKENDKYVIGVGVKNSCSELLTDNCDEFLFYDDLVRGTQRVKPRGADIPDLKGEAFDLLVDSLLALRRENKEVLWSSMVKETMKRKRPYFTEEHYGYRTFSALLEDAARFDIIRLERDERSRSYIVSDFIVP